MATIYADYGYYCNEYFGTLIPKEKYNKAAMQATQQVNKATFGRIKEVTDIVKNACCAAAEEIYSADQAKSQKSSKVASETVGNHSVTYNTGVTTTVEECNEAIYNAIKLWLGDSGLMYRGVYHDT